jgi:hypothetical protein
MVPNSTEYVLPLSQTFSVGASVLMTLLMAEFSVRSILHWLE